MLSLLTGARTGAFITVLYACLVSASEDDDREGRG